MKNISLLIATLIISACAQQPTHAPQYAQCYTRALDLATGIFDTYQTMGYHFTYRLMLDENMLDFTGNTLPDTVLGHVQSGGQIRIRPSVACQSDMAARLIIAHEMAHVALNHHGTKSPVVLTVGNTSQSIKEIEADQLAAKVLERQGTDPRAAEFLRCRLGLCLDQTNNRTYQVK